jgi:uncharacterized paraquat-inducible protein A
MLLFECYAAFSAFILMILYVVRIIEVRMGAGGSNLVFVIVVMRASVIDMFAVVLFVIVVMGAGMVVVMDAGVVVVMDAGVVVMVVVMRIFDSRMLMRRGGLGRERNNRRKQNKHG